MVGLKREWCKMDMDKGQTNARRQNIEGVVPKTIEMLLANMLFTNRAC